MFFFAVSGAFGYFFKCVCVSWLWVPRGTTALSAATLRALGVGGSVYLVADVKACTCLGLHSVALAIALRTCTCL